MADQIMRSSPELDSLKPEVWSALFYETLLEALPFNAIVDRRYEGEIRALGDVVNATQFPQFDEAEDILEGQKVDANALTSIAKTITINIQTVKDYIITDYQTAVVNPAKIMAMTVIDLLSGGGAKGKEVIAGHRPAMKKDAYISFQREQAQIVEFSGGG